MDSDLENLQVIDDFEVALSRVDRLSNFSKYNLQFVKSTDFTIIAQNIRSIYKNFDDLSVSLANFDFETDLLVLTECMLDDNKPVPQLRNYKTFSTVKHVNKCDGVVVYIKNTYKSTIREIKLTDASCVQVTLHGYIILCIYRSPSNKHADEFISSLCNHLDSMKSQKNIVITGDINININTTDKLIEHTYERKNRLSYLNMLASNGLFPGHLLPTRELSCLDHFILKMGMSASSATVIVFDSTITDHRMILLKITNIIKTSQNKLKCKNSINYEKALQKLKECNLLQPASYDDPAALADISIAKIQQCLNDYTKTKRIASKDRIIKPWITPGILKCIRNRNVMQQKLRSDPFNEILKITYKRYRNFCNNLIRKLKTQYDRELLAKNKNNPKTLWQSINVITSRKTKKTNCLELLDVKSSPQLSVNYVNGFFASIGKTLAQNISINYPSQQPTVTRNVCSPPSDSFAFLNTDCEEVYKTLMSLKSESAPGWDNIPTRFLKMANELTVPLITQLTNLCFQNGCFPDAFKKAIITPVYKSGCRDDVSNYRPISVLTALSKVLEKIINKRLTNYLNKINFLSKSQYGFRQNISTEDAVTALTTHIVENVDRGIKCIGVFLDLKKAFDTVSVPILIKGLENIGIRGVALNLFADYLKNRKQYVKIDGHISNECDVTNGVPQGSVLGPTLFLIYINSLCNMEIEGGRVFSYADDTAIVFTGESWSSVRRAAELGLAKVNKWLQSNLLTLNTTKTNYIAFTNYRSSQPEASYDIKIHSCQMEEPSCDCSSITKVAEIKYLGVMLDDRLTWHAHLEIMMGRTRKLIWVFNRLRHIADKKLLKIIYMSLAQSLLAYCIPVWGGATKTKFLDLERAQRAMLKVMHFKPYRFSTKKLYKLSDTLSVRQLFILHTIIRVHKELPFDPSTLNKRRNFKVAANVPVRTVFAKRQFKARSGQLYNKINKILKIYPMNKHTCKTVITRFLKSLDYEETEKLLNY